jgi:uncharacterized membrane protein HdeD (DUF308 family)
MVSCFANRMWYCVSHIVHTLDSIGLSYSFRENNSYTPFSCIIGVERIASGIVAVVLSSSLQRTKTSGRRRKVTPFTNIGLGAVAIVFAIIALASPALKSERSLTLLSVAISVVATYLAFWFRAGGKLGN